MKNAFSLMELMIVIIILGLLATLVMPNLIGRGEDAKQKLTCVQMKTLSESIKMFKAEQGSYPTTKQGLQALIENPDEEKYTGYPSGGYLDGSNIPLDPWKNEYIYITTENGFDLISLGADGEEGGTEVDKDIRFSQCQQQR